MPPARPLPIGVFLTSFWPGGTERQTLELVRRLDRGRFTVHLACFHREGTWRPLIEEAADSVTEFPVAGFRSRSAVAHASAFRAWCRDRQLVVLHASDLYANIFGLPLAASAGVRVRIGSRREINPDKTPVQLAVQRFAYAFAHRIVANSSAAASRLRREGVGRRRIVHVPNGIDLASFYPASDERPARRLVSVARLRPEKGHEELVAAFAIVARAFRDTTLTIVGDGPLRERLETQIAAHGLTGRARIVGHRDDVPALLREHDLFVLASRSEAFPNAVLEAMATGLPVVATGVGGIPELVEHAVNGLLVAPGQAEVLAGAIAGLLTRPSFARALGRRARADVEARYSFHRMVQHVESLYLAELAMRGPFPRLRSHSQPATS
jgi:glycosyltransferase involved in cell wall biosynthesis